MSDAIGDFDRLTSSVFDLADAGVGELLKEAAASPLGEREYWRRVLVDDPNGPQMPQDHFEVFWEGISPDAT